MESTAKQDPTAFKRIEFLVVTKNAELLSVSKDLVEHYKFRAEYSDSVDTVDADTRLSSSPMMILISLEEIEGLQERMKNLQQLRAAFPRSHIVAMVAGDESTDDCEMLRGSGARYLVLLQEIKNSSKLYYLAALLVQGTYIPVPVSDLFPSTQVNFNAYHKLVLNQKFLPVIFSGFTFSDKKYRQLETAQQVYVRREELGEYRKYIETYHDQVGAALKKRCRVMMMSLMALYSEILLLLSLDCEAGKKDLVQSKVSEFVQGSQDLGRYLKDCPDVWNVIAKALDFQFCRYERGPYILAYAVYISLKADWGQMQDVVMTALLADLGILDLTPESFKTLQKKNEKHLKPEELERYRHHPMNSLNRVMLRELEVSNETKSSIVCTHERNDLKGFPNQSPADKIPAEAQLIHFCELLDRRVRASLEDGILTHDFVRKQVWEEEKDSLKRFNAAFLDKIEKVLVA
ncbi:HD domain-containing phosphohydrolase [Bdellovibrio sp. HCB337]|uniref:HD domain-containing phosphohydrolase n=1 Tax=Bdellovibrio sp. HCB337 TaxID=3394358 RepID=UPI0039A499B7